MFRDTKTIIGAALLAAAVTACKPKDYFDPDAYKEIISKAFPVSGVDPQHQWKLMRTVTARITVNWYDSGDYRVDIYASDPMSATSALLMGGGTVADGATLTTPLSCPMSVPETVFVALTDPRGHRTVKTARLTGGTLDCRFDRGSDGGEETQPGYSVMTMARPDVAPMTTGTTEFVPGSSGGGKMAVSGTATAWISALETTPGSSLAVSGTWTLERDQTVGPGATVVVMAGGRIVIPSGMTLTAAPRTDSQPAGRIIIMPGAAVEGGTIVAGADGATDGGTAAAVYNAGDITVSTLALAGTTVYNADGALIDAAAITATADGARLVNHGSVVAAKAGQIGSATAARRCCLALENACRINVSGRLTLGATSRIGRGAYVGCGSLELLGAEKSGDRLFLAPDAFVRSNGRTDIHHFGIMGPTVGGYAFVAVGEIGTVTADASVRSEHIAGRVNLVYPQGAASGDRLYNIYNGNASGSSIYWSDAEKSVVTSSSPAYTREAGGCSEGFTSLADSPVDQEDYAIRYLFEDNFPQEGDYDFNDLVLTVAPRVDGRDVTLRVTLNAVGSTKQMAAAIRVSGVSRSEVTAASMEGDFDFNNGKPVSSYMIIDSRDMLLPDDKNLTGDLVINLFSDAHWAMSHTMESNGNIRRWLYNTADMASLNPRPDCADVPPVTVTYRLTLASPEAAARFVADNLDAFVIESSNGLFFEVHTHPYKLEQVIYQYIKDPSNYADTYIWALQVPSQTRWPLEGVIIGSNRGGVISGAYQRPGQSFCEWAISRSKALNWWMYPTENMVK